MLDTLERLSHDPRTSPFVYAFVVLLGLLWGSFANVCIYRWPPSDDHPNGRSVVKPGSHCFACKQPIAWYDNVPLLSWLWLRGQCRACKAPFSARYLLVEALTGILFGLAWYVTVGLLRGFEPFDARLVRWTVYAGFSFVMVVTTFIDIDHKLILNKLMIPSIVIFYVLGAYVLHRGWLGGAIGIAVGYGVPWLIGFIYFLVTKRDGLGLGDSMLLALVGALLGWKGVVVSLCGGSMVGSVIGIFILWRARRDAPPGPEEAATPEDTDGDEAPSLMRTELPFGPYLAFAATFYLFAEPWIELHFALFGPG
ncbi:MAG: prepilin peptidase [Deltaproteobacteria bacterium]|nr:prepilin peptidase [Deltaproteobacteria bacterium]